MAPPDKSSVIDSLSDPATPDIEERAADLFLRRRSGDCSAVDQAAFEAELANDAALADAARRVERAWAAVGDHATSPELMVLREQALARARRTHAHRWLHSGKGSRRKRLIAASIGGITLALGVAWQLSPYGFVPGQYQTGIGEQRVVELKDHSRIALDSQTRLRVRFSKDARVVELSEGQVQFSVAKDPNRPFKVVAGGHSIVAVGTSFTVEYVDEEMRVALLEGRVSVTAAPPAADVSAPGKRPSIAPARTTELTAGEELRIRRDGRATVIPKADLEAAVAWRQGKVIFHAEALVDAVRRLNRYSRLQLQIDDPALARMSVSGVFEAGDTEAFAEALQSYLPVTADYSDPGVVRLKLQGQAPGQ